MTKEELKDLKLPLHTIKRLIRMEEERPGFLNKTPHELRTMAMEDWWKISELNDRIDTLQLEALLIELYADIRERK